MAIDFPLQKPRLGCTNGISAVLSADLKNFTGNWKIPRLGNPMGTGRFEVFSLWQGYSSHGLLQGQDAGDASSIWPCRQELPQREIGIQFDVS
jgi:hypothetical protein